MVTSGPLVRTPGTSSRRVWTAATTSAAAGRTVRTKPGKYGSNRQSNSPS